MVDSGDITPTQTHPHSDRLGQKGGGGGIHRNAGGNKTRAANHVVLRRCAFLRHRHPS